MRLWQPIDHAPPRAICIPTDGFEHDVACASHYQTTLHVSGQELFVKITNTKPPQPIPSIGKTEQELQNEYVSRNTGIMPGGTQWYLVRGENHQPLGLALMDSQPPKDGQRGARA